MLVKRCGVLGDGCDFILLFTSVSHGSIDSMLFTRSVLLPFSLLWQRELSLFFMESMVALTTCFI